jgi:DNA-binding CsgD family transcriptional regulator
MMTQSDSRPSPLVPQLPPHLPTLQQALTHHTLVWLSAPQGYDQQALCRALADNWSGPVVHWPQQPADGALLLITNLDILSQPQQQVLAAWLQAHPDHPCLLNSTPCAPLEGQLRAAGLRPLRLGASRLGWTTAERARWLLAQDIPEAEATVWCPRLGEWPLAWQLWQQARSCDGNTAALLQRWGLELLTQILSQFSAPIPEALALQAEHVVLDEPQLLQLAGCSRGQWLALRSQLLTAGWLLEEEAGDRWQPWIAHLLGIWREQPDLDWEPLSRSLADLSLSEIRELLPLTPLPQLELSLLSRIGLRCLEQSQGPWLAARLAALPRLWLQQQPSLCLLQAWLEMEVHRRSDRAEDLLNRLMTQPLPEAELNSAQLLKAMVSFNFDHLPCAMAQLAKLKDLPQSLQAPFQLTEASCLLFTGQLTRARTMLELLVSWADCQRQYHLKLVGWYRLAQLHFFQGDWQQSGKVMQSGLEFAEQQGLSEDPVLDSYYRLQAELALYQGQPDQADYWLQQGKSLTIGLGDYWQLPYLAHRCLTLIWRGELAELPSRLEQLEQQRFSQQYCRLWRFRVGYTLALGYQQRDDQVALERLERRSPWHTQIDDLYDLLDNLLHGWLAQLRGLPKQAQELRQLQALAEEWQMVWLARQFQLLQLLQGSGTPEQWQQLLSWLAGRSAFIPLLLAGPRVVAPLQELARWPQIRPTVLAFIQQTLDLLTRPLRDPQAQPGEDELSPRQWQILRLIAQGLSNEQMAQQLFVAPSTIKTHINHLYAKLGVRTRAEAQAVARQRLVGK